MQEKGRNNSLKDNCAHQNNECPPAQKQVITFQLNSFSSKKILMNELP
jgi:hypothetical protein